MNFSELKGKTLTAVTGAEKKSDVITFTDSDGNEFKLYHDQDCCESVNVEDICGDVADLIGSPLLLAEEVTSNENPPGYVADKYQDNSYTWTFYKLATMKGAVTIRWYGESNGYYSERVDFEQSRIAAAPEGTMTATCLGEAAFGRAKGQTRLWKVSPPVLFGEGKATVYLATSAAVVDFSGPETYIFPTDENGKVLDWAELDGSIRGVLDHEAAIKRAGYTITGGI